MGELPETPQRSTLTREVILRGLQALPDELGKHEIVSARHETTIGNLPQYPYLRVTMPVPEYLLAMNCMAARIGGTHAPSDVADLVFLIRPPRTRWNWSGDIIRPTAFL